MDFLEILKYTLPSLILAGLVYFLLDNFFKQQLKLKQLEIKSNQIKELLPSKLQAYERLIIFLERSTPTALLLRFYKADMMAVELQSTLINGIKSEFEHNLAQQIFVSKEAWEITRNAKEEMIRFIMTTSGKLPIDASGLELSKILVEIASNVDKLPTQIALDMVKQEAQQFVN